MSQHPPGTNHAAGHSSSGENGSKREQSLWDDPFWKPILRIIIIVALVMCCTLPIYLIFRWETVECSTTLVSALFVTEIVFGGAIISTVLYLLGGSGEFKIAGVKLVGGYAVVAFICYFFKPSPEDFTQIVTLHDKPRKVPIPYTVDLTDPLVEGDQVVVKGARKADSNKPCLVCRFKPGAKTALVTFTVRANAIPFNASVKVSRSAGPEADCSYDIE